MLVCCKCQDTLSSGFALNLALNLSGLPSWRVRLACTRSLQLEMRHEPSLSPCEREFDLVDCLIIDSYHAYVLLRKCHIIPNVDLH